MGREMELTTSDTDDGLGAEDFLKHAADEDLLAFMRHLPMVASHQEDRFTLGDLIFEIKLWPFVKQAWTEIKGSPGIPGRLTQITKVYAQAEADFEGMTGETRRVPRLISLPAFMDAYTTVGLP